MTYRPPWMTTAPSIAHSKIPTMEPLAPNPLLTQQPAQQTQQTRPGPQAHRALKQGTHAKLVQAAREQPRDSIGRFAEKRGSFTHFFDPTPRGPTSLKRLPAKQAIYQRQPSISPLRRASKRRRKKPVPERSILGKTVALFNGDYAKWRIRNLREQAKLRAQIDGHYPSSRKRARRRRKPAAASPASPTRKKRGLVRRILGL